MFETFSSSQNAKFNIISATIEEMVERMITKRMSDFENLLIGRRQGMMNQTIAEYGGSLSSKLEHSFGTLGEETSVALNAYQRVLDKNVELAGEIKMVARYQMLMDRTLSRLISNYHPKRGEIDEDLKQGTELKVTKKKAFPTII